MYCKKLLLLSWIVKSINEAKIMNHVGYNFTHCTLYLGNKENHILIKYSVLQWVTYTNWNYYPSSWGYVGVAWSVSISNVTIIIKQWLLWPNLIMIRKHNYLFIDILIQNLYKSKWHRKSPLKNVKSAQKIPITCFLTWYQCHSNSTRDNL